MLYVKSPRTRMPEREYIYGILFRTFLGLDYMVAYEEREDIEISARHGGDMYLRLADTLLKTDDRSWLRPESMPRLPLDRIDHPKFGHVPVLYGKRRESGRYFEELPGGYYCGIDIAGSLFFLLTRYEELVEPTRDARDRFPSTSSVMARENVLHRPIANEYAEMLREAISRLWPGLRRKPREPSLIVSHDVDWPFYVFGKSRARMLKESLADAIKRQNIQSFYRKSKAIWSTRKGDLTEDPFNTFRWLMNLSEQAGIRSAFYFITEETVEGMDGNYSVYDPEIQKLMREIHGRGHEIGLHPSYDTYSRGDRIKRQFDILLDVASRNGIEQEKWGGRQHFLRWKGPETWQHWEDAGLDYDSTLGFADSPGFRCGTCYEYPVFNVRTRRQLALTERPLIVMEQTVWRGKTAEEKGNAALEKIGELQRQCKAFGGDFTLLWHNSEFVTDEQRSVYRRSLNL